MEKKEIKPSCATSYELTKNMNIVSVIKSKVKNIDESQTKCGLLSTVVCETVTIRSNESL
jgi:superfamily I DNA and RNA helicase